jgi:hypothetical protein
MKAKVMYYTKAAKAYGQEKKIMFIKYRDY